MDINKLNQKQQDAALTIKGPLLVIAGAGSGKTNALACRIAYLMKEIKINPWNILAVTFTNKAANEMKERVIKHLGIHPTSQLTSRPHGQDNEISSIEGQAIEQNEYFGSSRLNEFSGSQKLALPHIGTFHSICVRILRKHIHLLNYDKSFVIYDTADQQILIKHKLEELFIDEKQFNPRAILSHISRAKNELIPPSEYHKMAHNFFTEKVTQVYQKYQKALQKNNALDFDDIIMKTVELFQTHPEVLDFYQEKFRYILIDEYQDTNHAQYILTNLLAQKYRNLMVIGDSDQSIYSFRGANITNILNFEKDYPEAKVVYLEQNYRSTQIILDAAHEVIIKNSKRKDKKLWTERKGGDLIKLKALENEREEGEFIAQQVDQLVREELKLGLNQEKNYRQFVVLYRTNAQSRVIEEVFLRYGLPYKIIGGIKFYERKEVKDVIAYLRVIQNPHDSVSLLRIINTPTRKIGAKTIETIQDYAIRTDISFYQALLDCEKIEEIRGAKTKVLEEFTKIIQSLQQINTRFQASGVIKHVIDYTGYKAFINDGSIEGEARLENIYELISVASKYDKLEPKMSLSIFLEEVSLIADIDNLDEKDNSITLMTIHSAKGLEFPVVFIAGLEDGIFPHSRSLLERDELEEERRLMYVALTRAKNKLYLLYAKNRLLYGESRSNPASQFLKDIPENLIEAEELMIPSRNKFGLKPLPDENKQPNLQATNNAQFKDGDKVFHQTFGEGLVISVTGGVATICFKDKKTGIKKLALSIAPLTKL